MMLSTCQRLIIFKVLRTSGMVKESPVSICMVMVKAGMVKDIPVKESMVKESPV